MFLAREERVNWRRLLVHFSYARWPLSLDGFTIIELQNKCSFNPVVGDDDDDYYYYKDDYSWIS